ncbi:glycosyltransferase [Paenibacillus sp. MMS18-CY102]|nr:glycosyltransferase [Paenibacillus sp. MMS18-CY102]MWC29416.1 glycosyltransferase [Paenibacillus sp. MMS18-CY102]
MMKRFTRLTMACLLETTVISPAAVSAAAAEKPVAHQAHSGWTNSKVKLTCDMRRLWIDHSEWTKYYIISAIAGLEDQEQVLARLLRNQQDIGNTFKLYYGEAAGNKLTMLLQEHIMLAGKVLAAAKAGNQAELAAANKEWYRNADDLARFWSGINPNWPEKQLRDILYKHLEIITEIVGARLKKDWAADILATDKGEDHLMMLADILSAGIMKQFPKAFQQ